MIGFGCKTKFDAGPLRRKAKRAEIRTITHAAGSVRKTAIRSIKFRSKKTKHSPKGTPPYTHGRRKMRRAILYAADRSRGYAVVGPSRRLFGTAGRAHELGGHYKGQHFTPRPTMWPALKTTAPRMPAMWGGQIT